jgi:hypothetical protein
VIGRHDDLAESRYATWERMWQVLGLPWIADHGVNHEMHASTSKTAKLVKRNTIKRDIRLVG